MDSTGPVSLALDIATMACNRIGNGFVQSDLACNLACIEHAVVCSFASCIACFDRNGWASRACSFAVEMVTVRWLTCWVAEVLYEHIGIWVGIAIRTVDARTTAVFGREAVMEDWHFAFGSVEASFDWSRWRCWAAALVERLISLLAIFYTWRDRVIEFFLKLQRSM